MTVGTSTDTRAEQDSESNLMGNEVLSEHLRDLERSKAGRGTSSHGGKDPGVHRPPRHRVKKDLEEAMIRDTYVSRSG